MEIIKFRRATQNWARLKLQEKKYNQKNGAKNKEEKERRKEVRERKAVITKQKITQKYCNLRCSLEAA
jgi:hypothetical protein